VTIPGSISMVGIQRYVGGRLVFFVSLIRFTACPDQNLVGGDDQI
jgi:hypothetical protein